MTEPEFQNLFVKQLEHIPAFARNSIRAYWKHNKIECSFVVSDEELNRLERERKATYRAAVTVYHAQHWRFLFRSLLLRAPRNILRTIFQHEYIHGFLCPHLHPIPNQRPLPKMALEKIAEYERYLDRILSTTSIREDPTFSYEETFVLVIQEFWKGDEAAANAWVEANCKHLL